MEVDINLKLDWVLNQWRHTSGEKLTMREIWKLYISKYKKVILGNESIVCKGKK